MNYEDEVQRIQVKRLSFSKENSEKIGRTTATVSSHRAYLEKFIMGLNVLSLITTLVTFLALPSARLQVLRYMDDEGIVTGLPNRTKYLLEEVAYYVLYESRFQKNQTDMKELMSYAYQSTDNHTYLDHFFGHKMSKPTLQCLLNKCNQYFTFAVISNFP